MTFKKGVAPNPNGNNGQPGRKVVTKCQKAIDKAIDLLGKNAVTKCGVTELAGLICEQLKNDAVGTLKALAPLLPKDVNIDVTHKHKAVELSDDELAEVIANNARNKRLEAKEVEGEIIETIEESTG